MTIACPISLADQHKLDNWVETIKKFGGLEAHTLVFVPTQSVTGRAYEAAGRLTGIAKEIRVEPLDMDSDAGWPKASNWQWFRTGIIMEALNAPWFWMELDCLPVRAGWADIIAGSYTSAGAPFMGCIVKTPWRNDATGKPVESLEGPNDKMMCGCGVYPAGMRHRFDMLAGDGQRPGQDGMLLSLSQGDNSIEIPWDLFLRHPMRRMGMAHTDVIADHWNTENYRIENGVLLCDPKLTDANNKPTAVQRAGAINPNAVVIHGCKDGSLFDLIMAGLDTRALTPIPKAIEAVKSTVEVNPEVAVLREEIAASRSETAELKAMLREALSRPAQASPQTSEEIPTPRPAKKPSNDTKTVLELLQKSTKKLRLDQVAEKTGLPLNKLKSLFDAPDAPFTMSGPLKWISLKQPA